MFYSVSLKKGTLLVNILYIPLLFDILTVREVDGDVQCFCKEECIFKITISILEKHNTISVGNGILDSSYK